MLGGEVRGVGMVIVAVVGLEIQIVWNDRFAVFLVDGVFG